MSFRIIALAILVIFPLHAFCEERANWASVWENVDENTRMGILSGFKGGVMASGIALEEMGSGELLSETREAWRRKTRIDPDIKMGAWLNAISSLYADPANAHITFADIVYIAQDQLHGLSTKNRLEAARKREEGGGK